MPAWGSSGGLRNLSYLNLRKNKFIGALPEDWAQLPLTHLLLPQQAEMVEPLGLEATLPAAWGSLSLELLDLSDNFLFGSVPDSWAQCVALALLQQAHLLDANVMLLSASKPHNDKT